MIAASFSAGASGSDGGRWANTSLGAGRGWFFVGRWLLYLVDKLYHICTRRKQAGRVEEFLAAQRFLVLAITLHNIPEGLAVGVGFGVAAMGMESASISSAIALALGIGIQNFPEGMAVSLPCAVKVSKRKAFMLGQLSGIVEPISALIGVWAVSVCRTVALRAFFAAGAMIYVVAEELIPNRSALRRKGILISRPLA